MRKILSKKDREKKDSRNKTIVGVILVIIMIFSTLGYAFYSSDDTDEDPGEKVITYSGINFIKTDYDTYRFKYGGRDYETYYNPEDTENISGQVTGIITNYANEPLYFGVNSREDLSIPGNREILVNMQGLILREMVSCLDEDCTENYPIKNCTSDNIIIFKYGEDINILQEDKCIYLYGPEEEHIRMADAFLFKLMKIQ